ncbi:MAG: Outer membrane porin protein 32 [Herbaspirillum frisingense]|uniref:Outer membrane porin protein 32 n=1 Tax=Herbaspirillum frisingense TaxID=92645 RepID=A0A7V8JTC5_9BURK|nr:MAG: Outer membrane porin protein 32 [Herbaspirillum frisingense]
MQTKESRRPTPAWARTLFIAAAAGAAPAAMAQSNVQMYGVLDLWMGSSKISGESASTKAVNSGGMTTSYWGMAGTEDLGGGMRALFTIEGYVQLDTGAAGRSSTDTMFSRSAFVGLGGNWGEVKLGRIINPLFYSTAGANPFGGSTRFAPLLAQTWTAPFGRAVFGDTSWDNAVSYTLPAWGATKVTAQYGFGEVAGSPSTNNLSLNVTYKEGPVYGTFHAQQTKVGPGVTSIGNTVQKTYFLGGSYDAKLVKLFGSYSNASADSPGLRSRTAQAGFSVPAGNGEIMASWARTRNDQNTAPNHRNTAALGYDYFLSKRTDLYVVSMYDKSSLQATGNSVGAGIRHRF